jgi:hypothetical protein
LRWAASMRDSTTNLSKVDYSERPRNKNGANIETIEFDNLFRIN